MEKLLLIISVVFIASCQDYKSVGSVSVGDKDFKIVCIDDVEYLLRYAGNKGYMAPHYKTDGSLYLCGNAVQKQFKGE